MTNMHFVTHLSTATALFQQFENDEAAGRAGWLGDVTHGHAAQFAIERRGQLGGLAPAHITAFQGVVTGRLGNGHLTEVGARSEEHTSELQSLMRISYAVFCLKKKPQ